MGDQDQGQVPITDDNRGSHLATELCVEVSRMRDRITRLTAEVAELRAAQTPRPMETAPRDGTQVLLELESGIRMMGRWLKDHGGAWELRPNYVSAKDSVFVGWLPLPAPTTEAT